MCAFDLPDGKLRDGFIEKAFGNGMLILGSGIKSVRFRPSLTLTRDECDEGVEIARRCLSALSG